MSGKYLTYKLEILISCLLLWLNQIMPTSSLFKSWRKDKATPKLCFYRYPKDQELCAVSTWNEYLKRTETWRTNGDQFKLLLCYIKSRVEVLSLRVSRWIKEILKKTDVDVDIFKVCSTCLASTSKPCRSGISMNDILNRGSWSNESTW